MNQSFSARPGVTFWCGGKPHARCWEQRHFFRGRLQPIINGRFYQPQFGAERPQPAFALAQRGNLAGLVGKGLQSSFQLLAA